MPIVSKTSYEYDLYGNPTKIHGFGDISITGDEKTVLFEYTYNVDDWILNRVKKETLVGHYGQRVAETEFYYDGNSNLNAAPIRGLITKAIVWNSHGDDIVHDFVYDLYGNLIAQYDGNGHLTTVEYGVNPVYPISFTNTMGHTTLLEYDTRIGKLTSITDPNGFETSMEYDSFGRIIKVIQPGDSSASPTVWYHYYNLNRWDFVNARPPPKELLPVSLNPNDLWDGHINLIMIRVKEADNQYYDTWKFYDGLRRVFRTYSESEDVSENIVQETFYNNFGDVDRIVAPRKSFEPRLNTTFNYDSFGRLIRITNPDGTLQRTEYDQLKTTYFDERGNKIQMDKDIYGNIIKVTEFNRRETYETRYEYDAANNLIRIIPNQYYDQSMISFLMPKENEVIRGIANTTWFEMALDSLVTDTRYKVENISFAYDSLGRLVKLDDPNLGIWRFEYNANGKLLSQTDSRGITTHYDYDALDRIILIDYPNDDDVIFEYDSGTIGTLSKVTTGIITKSYLYDERLRVIEENVSIEGYENSFGTRNSAEPFEIVIQPKTNTAETLSAVEDVLRSENTAADWVMSKTNNLKRSEFNQTKVQTDLSGSKEGSLAFEMKDVAFEEELSVFNRTDIEPSSQNIEIMLAEQSNTVYTSSASVNNFFEGDRSIIVDFEEEGFRVRELHLENFRVTIDYGDTIYVYLNDNREIFRFHHTGSGGRMNVFDENGYPLGTIAPMNGHPNFENITFNISFYYDPLTSEMEIEIERNFGNQITHYSYSYEASEPISYMRVYIDGWQSQSYVSGEYHVSYDPVDIVPGSGSFVNKEDITLSLEKEGYALQEITLKNLRVSMEEDDVAYVLLNDREVLRFVDDWGGGVLYVFNEQGATLGTIEPVNGKPYYENILFDIRFAQIDSEMVYIFIEKRDGREVTKYQYGSVVLDEPITTLRLYMDGYQSGIDYITGKYESVYTPSLPQDETFLSFKNKESFIIHNEGSEIENLELKNFRVAMGIYDSASVYLNNFEILRFTDTPEGGILQILDEDGNVLDLISQVNGHPLHENVTFNVNFDKTESSLIMDIEKMKDGIVVDERSYDMDYETLIAYSHIYLFGYQSGANYIRSQYKVHGESDVLIFDNFVSSGSFALAQSVTIPLSTNAWTVPEVNLKNFRASMGAGDRAFIHINNHEILRFVDSSSGGTLHIFNENGQQLGTISRVNGKPTVENVTFNIDFIKTDSQVLIRIEKFSGGRPDGTFHYAYNSLNEFGEMRASIQGFQANVDYVSGDYEIKHKLKPHGEYELVLPRPDKPLHPNENMFLNENDISIDFDTLKSYPSEISITNFRTVPVEDMYVWISLNEMEIIGIYDEESRGTIEVNGPERYWMIRDVTSNVSWENVTFNILFTADLNRLNTVIEKMEHGELIDTYTYSFDYEEPIPIWNMRIEIEDYYQLGTGFFEGEISVNLSYYSETPYEPMEFGPDFITTFSYDSMDRIVQKTLPNGKIVDYFYNNQGLLEWIPGVIYNIDYNSMNLITKVEFANDVSTDLTYDSLTMRIANINTPGLQNLDYSFDEKGNVVGIADHILGENQYFFYDDLDRLLLAGSENYAQSFVYNPLGSILAHRSVDLATMDEIIFGFEFGNGAGIHAPTRVGEMDLFYDANGNLIEDEIFIYVYNDANRLVEVLKKDEDRVIAEFAYDATGSRFKKVENGVVSYYINQFFDVVNGEETVYYFANGDRIAKDSAEGRFWYLNDHLGSTNVMIDADGELVERTLYYPFGAQREGGEEKYSFTGKELDSEIGLYYFEARYYNSEIFVFTQADSFIPNVYNPQSLNRYAYCYNNPLRYTDPTGHAPHDEFPTLHAAVYDSAGYMVALAKETKFEHATYYYFENGFYSYADPWHSENNTSVNVHKADNLEHNISHQQKSLNIVAFSHTHPRVASFSSADGEWARYLKLDFYLFVETGPILVHQWETGDAPRLYYNHASQTFQTTPIVNSGSVSSGGVNSGSGSSSIWGSATTAVNNTVNTISNTFNKVISWFK